MISTPTSWFARGHLPVEPTVETRKLAYGESFPIFHSSLVERRVSELSDASLNVQPLILEAAEKLA